MKQSEISALLSAECALPQCITHFHTHPETHALSFRCPASIISISEIPAFKSAQSKRSLQFSPMHPYTHSCKLTSKTRLNLEFIKFFKVVSNATSPIFLIANTLLNDGLHRRPSKQPHRMSPKLFRYNPANTIKCALKGSASCTVSSDTSLPLLNKFPYLSQAFQVKRICSPIYSLDCSLFWCFVIIHH